MLPLVPANDERAKEWEAKALDLIWIDGCLPAIVRALGRLDSFLRSEDRKTIEDADNDIPSFNIIEDYLALSQLWIFGAYELPRSLDQKLKKGIPNISADACKNAHDLKLRFARIRMPLAKFEPARSFECIDEVPKGAAVLANARTKGWSWQLNSKTYVWRHDLANELLSLLDLFPNPLKPKATTATNEHNPSRSQLSRGKAVPAANVNLLPDR
jgi:hypothetical protein